MVTTYLYDAWGNHLNTTGSLSATVGRYNPLRYRGYVYDRETKLYYLQSRYYNPEIGRFINADGYVSTGTGINGYNMFAYCNDNPIILVDLTGEGPVLKFIKKFVKAVDKLISHIKEAISAQSYNAYLDALGKRESSDDYTKENEYGYMGRYQMGSMALQDAGFKDSGGNWTKLANSYGVYSSEDFRHSPTAQDYAVTEYHKKLCNYIQYYELDSYIGSQYCGVTVTASGHLAACHLVGVGDMKKALLNNVAVWDGNGVPASEYMELLGNYNISWVW